MIFNAASAVSLRVRVICFICVCVPISVPETSAVRVLPVDFFRIRHYADMSGEWNLILVGRDHYVPKDYEVTLAAFPNLKQVDKRILPFLTEMFLDAREAGIEVFVREGYRSREDQKKISSKPDPGPQGGRILPCRCQNGSAPVGCRSVDK